MLETLGDRVRRVVDERRHDGQRPGQQKLSKRVGALEAALEADRGHALRHLAAKCFENELAGPARRLPPEEDELDPGQQIRIELTEARDEDADAFPLTKLPEERKAADRHRGGRLRWTGAESDRLPQVWDHSR